MRMDDMYSFNKMYAPTPFECIKQHFAKIAYEHRRVRQYKTNTSIIATARRVYSINRRK